MGDAPRMSEMHIGTLNAGIARRFFWIVALLHIVSVSHAQNNTIFFGGSGGGSGVNCLLTPLPLPTELVYFKGNCEGEKINFSWLTASERNTSLFSVEESTDGIQWESVTKLPAAGNSSSELFYSSFYTIVSPSLHYFRLKQIDTDGASTYSEVITVKPCLEDVFATYPNPATEHAYISFPSEILMGEIVIRNFVGRVVQRTAFQNATGVDIDLRDIATGQYHVSVYEFETLRSTTKLVRF